MDGVAPFLIVEQFVRTLFELSPWAVLAAFGCFIICEWEKLCT